MAYTVPRPRKPRKGSNKPEYSYQVKWRTGGNGDPQAETFRDVKQAALFEAAVEAAGEQWPANYIPKMGWVDPDTYRRLVGAQPEDADAAPSAITLEEFSITWAKSLSGIEGESRRRYLRILYLHILPWFGAAAVADTSAISATAIGTWINQLQDGHPPEDIDHDAPPREPLGPKSIRNIHGVLSAVLQSAADAEPPLRATNPCRKTRLPKLPDGEGDEEMVFLTPEEFDSIAVHMQKDAMPLTEFLVGTGLRYSEATALQIRDLDLLAKRPRLSVRRAWKKQDDGTWAYGPPKTPKSKRNVALTARQVAMLLPLTIDRRPTDLVFAGPTGGRWVHQTFYTYRWRPAVYLAVRCDHHRRLDRAAGIGTRGFRGLLKEHIVPCGCAGVVEKVPRIHDLRHSHVAWLIAANQPMPAIQRRLGHESIQTTIDRYGHLLPEIDDDLVEALDAMMNRGKPPRLALNGISA